MASHPNPFGGANVGCCIAIATVIAVVRAVYFRLFPHRRPPESGFAPPAYRPPPGAPARAATGVSAISAAAPAVVAVPWTGLVFAAAAITVAVYAAVVEVLSLTGVGDSGAPLVRHLLVAGVGLGALVAAAAGSGRPVPPKCGRGLVLASAGATWTVTSLIDMHAFGVLHHSHGGVNLLVHGVGLFVLAVGIGQLIRPHAPRPGGTTLRTAITARTP